MSSFIPDSAPFTEEQRAWLNGFFTGLMGIGPGVSPGEAIAAAGIATEAIGSAEPDQEDFPWHDEALPIVDRMELAQGRPIEQKLMAAMAQLDCGTCGYVCQTYGQAIAAGEETNLTLCSPGGKETKQMIKKLLKEQGDHSPVASNAPNSGHAGAETDAAEKTSAEGVQPRGWSRQHPFSARLVESRSLNGPGSAKDTRHVVIDLAGAGLTYEVGDALGVFPTNCRELAMSIVERLGADPMLTIPSSNGERKHLIEAMVEDYCLKDPTDELLELLVDRVDSTPVHTRLKEMLDEGTPDGVDVLDVMSLANEAPVTATEVIETLAPITPRLYSIASSMKRVGDTVHLTVGKVTYDRDHRARKGVASTMLAERLSPGDTVRVFVQPNHGGFTVPADPSLPMIMVGPGTGIAPFLAFLQERAASQCAGKNWLFFGDQHAHCDFLYRDQLQSHLDSGTLTRLDTAFSRDGRDKVYVQDRMRQNAGELWRWLQSGAHFFVCGDASRMAADVDRALIEIVADQGHLSPDQAQRYVAQLKKQKRYVRDVY